MTTTSAAPGATPPDATASAQSAAVDVNSRRRHVVISIAILAAAASLIALLSYGLMLDQSKVPPANIGKVANPFKVAWIQGNDLIPPAKDKEGFSLDNLRGRPVVLNFWASWCVSCREEAREMEKFWQAHKDRVAVVGIAIQDNQADAKKFAAYFGKTYALGLDEDGKAAIDYGVSGVPETFLIDRNGIIQHKEIGPVDSAQLEGLLSKIL